MDAVGYRLPKSTISLLTKSDGGIIMVLSVTRESPRESEILKKRRRIECLILVMDTAKSPRSRSWTNNRMLTVVFHALCGDLSRTTGRFFCRGTSRANCCKELADDRHEQFGQKNSLRPQKSEAYAERSCVMRRSDGAGCFKVGARKRMSRHCHSR